MGMANNPPEDITPQLVCTVEGIPLYRDKAMRKGFVELVSKDGLGVFVVEAERINFGTSK